MSPTQFYRILVILNGAVPLAILTWDAWQGQLGANSVNQALHITGILSLVFLFLSLLITPLGWFTGWGGWVAFRRALGLYGFFYACIHLVIYVGFDRALSLSSTLHEVWMRRFLQVGTAAILLMVPLAVTSTNAMIQKLGPKRWKMLHRTTYLVAILGVLHYFMLVKSDVRQPLAFAAVLACLLGTRVIRAYSEKVRSTSARRNSPAQQVGNSHGILSAEHLSPADTAPENNGRPRQGWKGELRVGSIVQETHDVKTFRLVPINGGPFPFDYRPGQFINLQLTIAERRVNRSYTLASSPSRSDHCELTIKRDPEGLASKYMHDQVRVGDLLKISGPSGKFTFSGDEADAVLLIAGGVGITPVMSILRFLSDRSWQGDIYFVVVSKTEEDLIFREEMRGLKQRLPRLHLRETLTRAEQNHAWQGDRGRISADLLTGFVPRLHETPVFLCGPNDMMDATCQLLSAHGVPASLIHTEAFAGRKSSDPKSPALPLVVPEVAAGRSALQTSSSPTRIIRFFRSNVQAEIDAETTVLEAAEAVSVVLPYECRSGICGQCKTRLIEGLVAMDCEDALSAQEKAAGFILSCQARLLNPAVVDA